MRRILPFVLFLVGCGGHESSHQVAVLPASPYGDLRFSNSVGYGGTSTRFDFVVLTSTLTSGTLTIGDTHETTEVASRTLEVVLSGYTGSKGKGYSVAKSEATLRLHEPAADGSDRVWAATGGRIVDAGRDQQRRLVKIEGVTVAPVEGKGSVGTAQLDGSMHIDVFGG